jgi:hypothetical protein
MYVVAFLSLHTGELKQYKVEADCEANAMIKTLDLENWELGEDILEVDQIYDMCANSDCYISAIEI